MRRTPLAALALALFVAACHDVAAPPETRRPARMEVPDGRRLAVDAAGWDVARLQLAVHGGPLEGGLEYEIEAKEGAPLVGAIDLPAGEGYAIEARGYDRDGRLVQAGKGELVVDEKLTPQVELVLEPVKGAGAWGRVRIGSLRLAASSHAITVKEGEPVQFDLGLVDADGVEQPLEPGTVALDWPFPLPEPPKFDVVYEGWRAFFAWKEQGVYGSARLCVERLACTDIQLYDGNGAVQLTAGAMVTCVRRGGGSVKCWGPDRNGETGELQGVSQVASLGLVDVFAAGRENASGTHVCGVDGQGRVWCWGRNTSGQLGNGQVGQPGDVQPVPQQVSLPGTAIDVTGGAEHSCALLGGGQVYCWGDASWGQLGEGTYNGVYGPPVRRTTPVQVWTGNAYVAIQAGDFHTCALTAAGEMDCWGHNEHGQLGVPQAGMPQCYNGWWDFCSATPVRVAGAPRLASIAAGRFDSCGVSTTGEAWCWGASYWGNASGTMSTFTPTRIGGGITWRSLSIGYRSKCGLDVNGNGACWGDNNGGQLGNGGTSTPVFTPIARSLGNGQGYQELDVGNGHACAIRTVSSVVCWGIDSWNGAVLGAPNAGFSATPIAVTVPW